MLITPVNLNVRSKNYNKVNVANNSKFNSTALGASSSEYRPIFYPVHFSSSPAPAARDIVLILDSNAQLLADFELLNIAKCKTMKELTAKGFFDGVKSCLMGLGIKLHESTSPSGMHIVKQIDSSSPAILKMSKINPNLEVVTANGLPFDCVNQLMVTDKNISFAFMGQSGIEVDSACFDKASGRFIEVSSVYRDIVSDKKLVAKSFNLDTKTATYATFDPKTGQKTSEVVYDLPD